MRPIATPADNSSIGVAPEDNPASEPGPGITILNRPARQLERTPMPGYIALIGEVSDTTFEHYLGPKARLSARAGIPEYWVLDMHPSKPRVQQHRLCGAPSS